MISTSSGWAAASSGRHAASAAPSTIDTASEIATPNLDTLADTGVKMTQFYASPFCSPTRAMLMSGSDNHLVGFGDMAELMLPEQRGKPGYEGYLNERVVSVAQVLKDAGYRTMMTGKWHLGVPEQHSPASRGFGAEADGQRGDSA